MAVEFVAHDNYQDSIIWLQMMLIHRSPSLQRLRLRTRCDHCPWITPPSADLAAGTLKPRAKQEKNVYAISFIPQAFATALSACNVPIMLRQY